MTGYESITPKEEKETFDLLDDTSIIKLNKSIKLKYVELSRNHRLKLPDAVIAATAIVFDLPLITADKHFKTIKELNLIAYQHETEGN